MKNNLKKKLQTKIFIWKSDIKISKSEMEIIKQLRNHQKLYKKICEEPKRVIDYIELKLSKEKVI